MSEISTAYYWCHDSDDRQRVQKISFSCESIFNKLKNQLSISSFGHRALNFCIPENLNILPYIGLWWPIDSFILIFEKFFTVSVQLCHKMYCKHLFSYISSKYWDTYNISCHWLEYMLTVEVNMWQYFIFVVLWIGFLPHFFDGWTEIN